MKTIRHSASTNGHGPAAAHSNGHTGAVDAASAKTISMLLARIDELETRLCRLEGGAQEDKSEQAVQNGDAKIPVVIISAVVASVLQRPHRILSIESQSASAWALQGRMQLHQARS